MKLIERMIRNQLKTYVLMLIFIGLFQSSINAIGVGKSGYGGYLSVSESGRVGLFDSDFSTTSLQRQGLDEGTLVLWNLNAGERPLGSVIHKSTNGTEVVAQVTLQGNQWRVRIRSLANDLSGVDFFVNLPLDVVNAQLHDTGLWFVNSKGMNLLDWSDLYNKSILTERVIVSGFNARKWHISIVGGDTVLLSSMGSMVASIRKSSSSWVEAGFTMPVGFSGTISNLAVVGTSNPLGLMLLKSGIVLKCPTTVAPYACEAFDSLPGALELAGAGSSFTILFSDNRLEGYTVQENHILPQGVVWPGWSGRSQVGSDGKAWGIDWASFVQLDATGFTAVGHQYHSGGLGFTDFVVTPSIFSAKLHDVISLSGVVSAKEKSHVQWIFTNDTSIVSSWSLLHQDIVLPGQTYFKWNPSSLKPTPRQGQAWLGVILAEGGDTIRAWKSIMFDSIPPIGIPKFTGALAAEPSWRLSSESPLVVHIQNLHDRPIATDSFKVQVELQQSGGNYSYRWDKWGNGNIDSLVINGRTIGNMALPSGLYDIRWRLVDRVGNSTDWCDSISIDAAIIRRFDVNPLPALLEASLSPNVLGGSSGGRTVATVDLLARKAGTFIVHYHLDSNLTEIVEPDTVVLAAGKMAQLKRTLRFSEIGEGIHQVRVRVVHSEGGQLGIAVPFIFGQAHTKILSPLPGETIEASAEVRGVVNPGPVYPAQFRVYRTYQAKGTVPLDTGWSWTKLMGKAKWQPMQVPISQQVVNVDSLDLYPGVDTRYPNSNLGASPNLAGGILATFKNNSADSVFTLLVVSEWRTASGEIKCDYDWVVIKAISSVTALDTMKVVLDRDTLRMDDSLTSNDTMHVSVKTSAPIGSLVEWVLSGDRKLATGHGMVNENGNLVFEVVARDALGQLLPTGEYDLYIEIAGARGGRLQSRNSLWIIAPELGANESALTIFPNPLLWNPALSELSHVQIDVNLPVPAAYRIEIHRPSLGLIKVLADNPLSRTGAFTYDLTDSNGSLPAQLWNNESVSYIAKLFADSVLVAERPFSVIAAELLQATTPILAQSALTVDSVQAGFRFQALAKGPIQYYPQRLVDYSSNVSGQQVLKYYKDVPYRLRFRKFYNSVELLSSSYYRVRKVDFINFLFGGFWTDKRERNTEPLLQRYSFFNVEDGKRDSQRRWADSVNTDIPEQIDNAMWYGDYPALKEKYSFAINSATKLLDPLGQSMDVKRDTVFTYGSDGASFPSSINTSVRNTGISSDFKWINFASFYNAQNPGLGALKPSEEGQPDDRPYQAFARSSTIKLGDDTGDDEWRQEILDGYINIFFMKRMNCGDLDVSSITANSPIHNDIRLGVDPEEQPKYFGELIYSIVTKGKENNQPAYPDSTDKYVKDFFVQSPKWQRPGEKVFMTNKENTLGMNSFSSWDFSWSEFGYDKYKANVYTYRPQLNWEHPYLQNEGVISGSFLNYRRMNEGHSQSKFIDPSPWVGEKSCTPEDKITRVYDKYVNGETRKDTVEYCMSDHGAPKHGIRGYVYKMDTTFVNRFGKTLAANQVIRNFYTRAGDSAHVYWAHPAYTVEFVNSSGQKVNDPKMAAGEKLYCDDADTEISDNLEFAPRLESDSLYALGVVWDTVSVPFPLLAGADTMLDLDSRTQRPFAFGQLEKLSQIPYRNHFDTLKSQKYARETSGGSYVDTKVYDLTDGYDSLLLVLDSVVMDSSRPLAIYNYIRSRNLRFVADLKSKELDARGRVDDSTAFQASNTYLQAEIDSSNGKHLLIVHYKAVPRSKDNWNASLDSSLAATNGWLYGKGAINRQMFLAQDSGLVGGFLGLVGTKGLKLPQASPSSMAPFVLDSGVVDYNPNLNTDSLQWDLRIYQLDGVTPNQAVSIVGANSQNMRLELQSQATLQATLPIRGHIDSLYKKNGQTYRFVNYRLQWSVASDEDATINDTVQSHSIIVNRFFVKPGGDAHVGTIIPDASIDYWAASGDTVPVLGYWNTTGLNGNYRLSLIATYQRTSDSALATLFESVPVSLGQRIKSGASALELVSQERRATMSLPAQYLDSNTLVSMHTLAPTEIGALPGLPNVFPVGPVIRVSTTGKRLFDEENLPSVTYRISARELWAMKGLSNYDNADSGSIFNRMKQDSGAFQIHILGDNGKLEALPTMVALNYALEEGYSPKFDRDAAGLILSASIPHFSYILMLPSGTHIPDSTELEVGNGEWNLDRWTDGPDPVVPACGTMSHRTAFESDRAGQVSRILLDNAGNMLQLDQYAVQKGKNQISWDGCADGSALGRGVYHLEYRFQDGPVILRMVGIGQAAGQVMSVNVDRNPYIPDTSISSPGVTFSVRTRSIIASRITLVVIDTTGDTLWTGIPTRTSADVDGSLVHAISWNGRIANATIAPAGNVRIDAVLDGMEVASASKWFVIGNASGRSRPQLQQSGKLSVPVSLIKLSASSVEPISVRWVIVGRDGDTSVPTDQGPANLGVGLSLVSLASAEQSPAKVGMVWQAPSGMGGMEWLNLDVQDRIPAILEIESMGGDTLDPEIPADWVARMGGRHSGTAGYVWSADGVGAIHWTVASPTGATLDQGIVEVEQGYGSFSWSPVDGSGKLYEEGSYHMQVFSQSPLGRDSLIAQRDIYVRRIPDVVVVLPDAATSAQQFMSSQVRELLIGRGVRRVKILDGVGTAAYLGYAEAADQKGLVAFVDSVLPHALFSGEARNPVYLAQRQGFNFAFLGDQPMRWKRGTGSAPVAVKGAALPLFGVADSYLRAEDLAAMDTLLFTGDKRSMVKLDTALSDGFTYALAQSKASLGGTALKMSAYRNLVRRARALDSAARVIGELGDLVHSAFYRPYPADGAFLVFSPFGNPRSSLLAADYAWMIDRFFFTPDIGVVESSSGWVSNRVDTTEIARGSIVTFKVRVRATGRNPLNSRLILKAPANNDWADTVEIAGLSPYVDGIDLSMRMPIASDAPFDTMVVSLSLDPVAAQDPADTSLVRKETDLTNNQWIVKIVVEDTVAPVLVGAADFHDTLPGFLSTGAEGFPYRIGGMIHTNHGFGSVQGRLRLLASNQIKLDVSDSCSADSDSLVFKVHPQKTLYALETVTVRLDVKDKYGNDTTYLWTLRLDGERPDIDSLRVANSAGTDTVEGELRYLGGSGDAVLKAILQDNHGLRSWFLVKSSDTLFADSSSNWNDSLDYQLTKPLPPGNLTLLVRDSAGNLGRSTILYEKDTVGPILTVYRVLGPHLPPADLDLNGLKRWRLYPNYRTDSSGIWPVADSSFGIGGTLPGNWEKTIDVQGYDSLELALWVSESNPDGSPTVTVQGVAALDTILLPRSIYVKVDPKKTEKIEFNICDLAGNCSNAMIHLNNPAPDLAYLDASGDALHGRGFDFGELHLHRHDSLGLNYLNIALHSYRVPFVDQDIHLYVYMDLDHSAATGTQVTLADGKSISGADARLEVRKIAGDDRDVGNVVSASLYNAETSGWDDVSVVEGNAQDLQSGLSMGVNQVDALWTTNIGEGYQVMPGGRVATAPGGVLELQWQTTGAADTIDVFIDDGSDALYDTTLVKGLPMVAKSFKALKADGFMNDWWVSAPEITQKAYYTVNQTIHLLTDTSVVVNIQIKNDGYASNGHVVVWVPISIPSTCADIGIRPASPPGFPAWVAPWTVNPAQTGVKIDIESSALTPGSQWTIPAVVVKGCNYDVDDWASRVGTPVVEDILQ